MELFTLIESCMEKHPESRKVQNRQRLIIWVYKALGAKCEHCTECLNITAEGMPTFLSIDREVRRVFEKHPSWVDPEAQKKGRQPEKKEETRSVTWRYERVQRPGQQPTMRQVVDDPLVTEALTVLNGTLV